MGGEGCPFSKGETPDEDLERDLLAIVGLEELEGFGKKGQIVFCADRRDEAHVGPESEVVGQVVDGIEELVPQEEEVVLVVAAEEVAVVAAGSGARWLGGHSGEH